MKVTVSVMGRFHAFNLAEALHRRGRLFRLIMTYPKFAARKFSIPDSRVTSLLPIGAALRLWSQSPGWVRRRSDFHLHEIFDRVVAKILPGETEVFIGWSSSCLESLRRAKSLGALAVVDEGSSHILFQSGILSQEFARLGLKITPPSPKIVEKKLREYDEAGRILAGSSFAAQSFFRHGVPEKKLAVVPYGVDLSEFKPVPREDKTFRVVFAGALSIRKGVHYLLQAFHELKLPRAELWLIGSIEPEMIPFLKKYRDPGIVCKGPFRQSELYRYYNQGSVFCLPSIEDGMGMVLTQAMACGLPLIATCNTGGPDLIENGREGYIVPIRDVERLKEKILYFHENPDAAKAMGEAARKRVENFTWQAYGDRVVAALVRGTGLSP